MKTIRIGNAAGFWGDSLAAPRLMCENERIDYLTLEYLAELTMSILAHQKSRDPQAGYVTAFPTVIGSLVEILARRPELKIVTNAGGMNPGGCAQTVAEILGANNLGALRVAAVSGDDILPDLSKHQAAGESFAHFDIHQPLGALAERMESAHAYLGARGIVEALAAGARIVITGRVADASLAVGPCVHEFGWSWDDWDRLGAATVAGHVIECGAQATGGIYSGWTDKLRLADVGYPIAEISDDASLVITKPAGSGGLVSPETVSEQLVYEIGDPAHYLTPDVDADFTGITLSQTGPDRVSIRGAAGRSAPERYKVSMAYRDGYMAAGTLVICGRDACAKARQAANVVFARVAAAGFPLEATHVELLGAGDSVPGVIPARDDAWELVLRLGARDKSYEAIDRFIRELAPLVTSGPPGVTGYTGARVRPQPVLAYWPTTIARGRVAATVEVRTAAQWTIRPSGATPTRAPSAKEKKQR